MKGDALMMKKILKQSITIIISIFMVLASCVVYADTYYNIAPNGETVVSVKDVADADRTKGNGDVLPVFSKGGYTDRYVSFNSSNGSVITFRVNVTERGVYELSLGVAESTGAVGNYAVSIDDGNEETVSAKGDGKTMYDVVYNSVMTPILEKGNHTITVKAKKASVHFSAIKLKFLVGEMEIEDIKLNGISVEETSNFSKGTDSIRVYFTEELNKETVTNDTVTLTYENDGKLQSIDTELKAEGKVLIIALKETLEDEKVYTVTMNGIEDKYGLTVIENKSTVFCTEEKDISNGNITAEAEIEYGNVTVSGKYLSSEGTGISGRNVNLYIDEVGDIPLASAVTESDGKFTIHYSFSEDKESGVYTLVLDGDYVIEPTETDVMYITKTKEMELLDSVGKMASGSQVEEFLIKYENIMGLDLVNDFDNVPNPTPVYEGLLNKSYDDVTKLQKVFYTYIALETINQAQEESVVALVLDSKEDCELLGIPFDRIHLIEKNYSAYIKEVLSLDTIKDADEFKNALSPVTEKWLSTEYGYADAEIDETDKTAYKGEGISINLSFAEKVKNLKKVLIKIYVSDSEMLEYMIYEASENVSFEVENGDGFVSVDAVCSTDEFVRNLGVIYLTAPEAGNYSVTINGILIFEENENLSLTTNVLEKIIDVTVKKTPSSGGNSGGSGGSSSGRGTSLGASMSVSDYNEQIKKEEQENTQKKYEFSDIKEVLWAEESIYSLLEKGIISESEDKCFNPMRNITREEFVKMLVCSLGLADTGSETTFNDVETGAWYYPYIASAEINGLVTGNENNVFCVGEYITRQDMSVIVARALVKSGYEYSEDSEMFDDNSEISEYAKDAVYLMRRLGIINGVGDNMFAPNDNATRAQAAKIIYAVTETVKK